MEKTTLINDLFKKAVNITNKFVSSRPNLPVLGNILIEATTTNLNLTATNLESTIKLKLPAKGGQEWATTVPARTLNDFTNTTSEKEIELTLNKESLGIISGPLSATIATIDSSEFPKLNEGKANGGEEERQKELLGAVSSVVFAASSDEGKPLLNGILFYPEEGILSLVTTDGYRLAKKTTKIVTKLEKQVVPAKILLEALKIAGDFGEDKVKLSSSSTENQLFIEGDDFLVSTRLLDGTYPEFNHIIPKNFSTKLVANKEELINAIRAASVFAQDLGNVVKLSLEKNQFTVTANTVQVGEGVAKIPASFEGEPLKIAFNSRFLLDGLNAISSAEVKFEFSGPLSPAMLRAEEDKTFFYVVMPVKVQN